MAGSWSSVEDFRVYEGFDSSKYLYSLPVVIFKKRNGEILLEHVDETIDNLRRLGFGVELHGPGWGFANLHK